MDNKGITQDNKAAYKVAAMGDRESILGFNVLGMDIFVAEEPAYAAKLLDSLVEDRYGIIYITEALALEISEAIDFYKDKSLPAIVLIPSILGGQGLGMGQVDESVKRAVGIDIFDNED